MNVVRYKGVFKRSWTNMANCLDLHVNSVIVIVYVNEYGDKNGIGHDQPCNKPPTTSQFRPSPAEQTP